METVGEAAETRYIPTEGISAYYGAIVFLAVLAYPKRFEWSKREKFVRAAKALLLKNYIAQGGNRTMIMPKYRSFKNKRMFESLRGGFRRIPVRLSAASMARCLILDGARVPFADSKPGKPLGLLLRAPNTVNQAAGVLLGDMACKGRILESDSGSVNVKHRIWASTLPVLHLAVAFFPVAVAHIREPLVSSEISWEQQLLWIYKPLWLSRALDFAERIRPQLTAKIPTFKPERAISLLPTDNLSQAYLLPAEDFTTA